MSALPFSLTLPSQHIDPTYHHTHTLHNTILDPPNTHSLLIPPTPPPSHTHSLHILSLPAITTTHTHQVAPLFILLPAFALHLFLLPYHKWWQNLIEAAVLIDYILLFLLRSTQTFLDNLSWYTGTSVPDTRASQLAETDRLTWLYFPFFYLPVVFGACFCVGAIVYHVAR